MRRWRRRVPTAVVVLVALVGALGGVPATPGFRAAAYEVAEGAAKLGPSTAVDQARAGGRRIEVTSERTEEARVFANPNGTFTREQQLPARPAATSWSSGPGGWALVYGVPADLRGQSYWLGDGDGAAKVGFSSWERPNVLVRSYFQYDIRALAGKQVLSAEFNAFQSYSPSCTPTPVQLWQTGVVEPWTTWDGQPQAVRELGTQNTANGYSSRCPADWVGFDVTPAAQDAAAGNHLVTLMLRAPDEGDRYQWKKFRPDPRLIITYNSVPDPPGAMMVGDQNGELACGVQPDEPYVRTGTPTLRATVSDPDGGPVAAEFEWWVRGERPTGSRTTVMQHSGTSFTTGIPADAFGDGSRIGWRVRGWDGTVHGPWSGWCDVTVDGSPPTQVPVVGSASYPPGEFGGGIGKTGQFTLRTGGDRDIVRFRYGLITPPTREVAAVDGAATVDVTPGSGDPHDLYVVGIDRAGNESPPAVYHFLVRTTLFPPVRHWRLDGRAPETRVPDALGLGSTGTLTPGRTAWTTGRTGDAVRFDGESGHVSMGPTSTIHTGASFSVSAWVRLDRLDGPWRTAVSQDGTRASGFYLQYRSDTRQWAFTVPVGDTDNFGGDRVSADVPVRAGVWTHLVGVYDSGEQAIKLYVDGRFAGRASHTPRWHATGQVQLGRGTYNGAPVDFWSGAIDEVRLYDRVLSDGRVNPGDRVVPGSDVHTLATMPAQAAGRWDFEENTPAATADTSGHRHTGTPQGGAALTAVGTGHAIALDGVDDQVTVPGDVVRTDTAFTVSARVRVGAPRATMTAVSQNGTRAARYALRYDGTRRVWVFAVTAADSDTPQTWTAVAPATVVPDRWTHLAAVYDASAEEVRLYVDGVPQATTRTGAGWHAEAGLRIGAALDRAQPSEHWAGAVDDVRVYNGVRTPDQIGEEARNPAEGTVFARDGLHRNLAHHGEHTTTGGPGAAGLAPAGHHLEHELGWFAPPGASGTLTLYSCLIGDDQFTSSDPRCEGRRLLGTLGPIYAEAPAGEPVIPLYRCRTSGDEHYESVHGDCEGGGTVEFRLGWMRAYAPLVRYVQPDMPGDHVSTVGGPAAVYRPEGRIGVVSLVARPGMHELFACEDGTDSFTSRDPGCEGERGVRLLGWVWPEAADATGTPETAEAMPVLRRCALRTSGERFDSTDPACEGHRVDTVLGRLPPRP